MTGFCEHLDGYGAKFVRAEGAYRHLNACMERILDDGPDEDRLDLVEQALVEWLSDVHDLRQLFLTLVNKGDIVMHVRPADGSSWSDAVQSVLGSTDPQVHAAIMNTPCSVSASLSLAYRHPHADTHFNNAMADMAAKKAE